MSANPEIASSIQTGAFKTNYHDVGEGAPVFLIHGSGPGVTAWANWRLVIPELAKQFRALTKMNQLRIPPSSANGKVLTISWEVLPSVHGMIVRQSIGREILE